MSARQRCSDIMDRGVGITFMQVNIDNFEEGYAGIYDISIAQREAGSRSTSQEEIDRIGEHPEARSIFVSGLDQEGFEYHAPTQKLRHRKQ